MPDVVSFGSVNVDLVANLSDAEVTTLSGRHDWFPNPDETVLVDRVPDDVDEFVDGTFLGGKGANQAVASTRANADTEFRGMVGADGEEYDVLATLDERGVTVENVGRADVETGKAYVFVTESGGSRIAIIDGANGRVDPEYAAQSRDTIRNSECLLLQNEIPTETMSALVDSLADVPNRPTIVFDPAPVDGAAPMLRHDAVDIVTPNGYESEALSEPLAEFDGTVIRTQGSEAVRVTRRNGERFEITPPSVTPVDTTGAGDVFNGTLGARLAAGETLRDAVSTAASAASLATTEQGAQRSIPSLEVTRDIAR